jgi:hypothetical protein
MFCSGSLGSLKFRVSGLFTLKLLIKLIFETPEDLKLHLQSVNADGQNIFHLIGRCNNIKVLSKFLEMFTEPEIVEMFLSLDKWNRNVFHTAVIFSSKTFIIAVFELIRKIPSDQLKEALKTSKIDGWNLFHCVACNKKHQVAGFVFEFVSEILGKDSAVVMLKEAEWNRSLNIFHLMAQCGNTVNFDQLLTLANTRLKDEEIQELLEAKTKNGDNVKQVAMKTKNKTMLQKCFEIDNFEEN